MDRIHFDLENLTATFFENDSYEMHGKNKEENYLYLLENIEKEHFKYLISADPKIFPDGLMALGFYHTTYQYLDFFP